MKIKKRVTKNKKRSEGIFRKLNNFVYSNFKLGFDYFKKSKNYFLFAFLIFLISIAVGYAFPQIFEKQILKIIQEIVKEIEGLNALELIIFIISNNLKGAFLGMIFGIFLGVIPFLITVVNGYLLGFVMDRSVSAQGFLILWRLFPHGIFEIPAVIISIGLGLRLGMFIFLYHKKDKRKEFWKWLKDSFRVFFLIAVPLLVIAGIIEGFLIWVLG